MIRRSLVCLPFIAALFVYACSSDSSSSSPTLDGGIVNVDGAPGTDANASCTPALPPSGFTHVAGKERDGSHSSLVLDETGAPVIAYQTDNGTGGVAVNVIRWSSATCAWSAPMVVDSSVNEQTTNGRQIAIARDASTGAIGVAYSAARDATSHVYVVRYAELAKTATAFSTPTRVDMTTDPTLSADSVGLAMANGKVYVAYYQPFRLCGTSECEAIVYRVRDGATWSAESVIGQAAVETSISLAADSEGAVGVAWIESKGVPGTGGVDMKARFARITGVGDGGTTAPSTIFDNTDTTGTDEPWVDLAFDGKKPRAVVILNQDAESSAAGKTEWFVASDDGATWAAPVALPTDNGSSLDFWASIAIGAGGKVYIASNSNSSNGTHVFGTPKVLTSTDLKTFTVVGAAPKAQYDNSSKWVSIKLGPDGKLQAAFGGNASDNAQQMGLMYFREP